MPDKKVYKPRFPLDVFKSGAKKPEFPDITVDGVELSAEQLKAASRAARSAGVDLVEVTIKEDGSSEEQIVQNGG